MPEARTPSPIWCPLPSQSLPRIVAVSDPVGSAMALVVCLRCFAVEAGPARRASYHVAERRCQGVRLCGRGRCASKSWASEGRVWTRNRRCMRRSGLVSAVGDHRPGLRRLRCARKYWRKGGTGGVRFPHKGIVCLPLPRFSHRPLQWSRAVGFLRAPVLAVGAVCARATPGIPASRHRPLVCARACVLVFAVARLAPNGKGKGTSEAVE